MAQDLKERNRVKSRIARVKSNHAPLESAIFETQGRRKKTEEVRMSSRHATALANGLLRGGQRDEEGT